MKGSVEFESTISPGGTIRVPEEILRDRPWVEGSKLHVRVTAGVLSEDLKNRLVTEEEIERIGAMQLETREQVVKFLLSEGSLRSDVRRRRK